MLMQPFQTRARTCQVVPGCRCIDAPPPSALPPAPLRAFSLCCPIRSPALMKARLAFLGRSRLSQLGEAGVRTAMRLLDRFHAAFKMIKWQRMPGTQLIMTLGTLIQKHPTKLRSSTRKVVFIPDLHTSGRPLVFRYAAFHL